ncbi:DUF2937 family protein [Roseospira goensis]|uniref:DUF2937 family protein n=1 Tax=Roseospira goensis TaxID=391922 RepID=A0A7W6WLG3_9PROT|nr:DUF2937 family protein [Roseospira goensis]MBB4286693.1 hypothetical protein [Roseospira goensis]
MPAGWVLRKVDSLGGAVVAALGGGAASQWREFLQQYLQRLGGHLDEARRQVESLNARHDTADPAHQTVLADMLYDSQARAASLTEALRRLTDADPVTQPLVFLRHMEPAVARATLETFQPALPLDPASLGWAGAGLVLALLLYELAKGVLWAPLAVATGAVRRRHRRRPAGGDAPAGRSRPRGGRHDRVEPRL